MEQIYPWKFLRTLVVNIIYPLNPELPGYKLGTSRLTAVLGKLQRIREKCQSIRETPEKPGWNPENLDYSQNWAKYMSKVLTEFDF